MTVGSIREATISPNNNFVAMISYQQSVHLKIRLYASISISTLLGKGLEGSELREEEEAKTKQRIISLGEKIAQLSIFRVNELPSYISFPTHTLKLPKGIEYFDDCYCGNYIEISSENESTKSKQKYGIANRTKIIVEPKYENIYKPAKDEKYAKVGNGNLYGVVDLKTGKEVLAVKYETIDIIGNSANVKESGKTQLMDLITGKEVASEEAEDNFTIFPLEDNRVIFIDDDFMGKIKDTKTNIVLGTYNVSHIAFSPLSGEEAFVNGLSPVYKDNTESLGGFINKKGDLVIPLIYEKVKSFSEEGLAEVKKDGKWIKIDKTGKCIEGCN
jgi:hypothetical protein